MADKQQLLVAKKGVKAWNKWRKKNANLQVDLSNAGLNGVKLDSADLVQASLIGASLVAADLGGANLSGADLGGANLIGANLIGANLKGANLSRAKIGGTTFAHIDLSEVKGLKKVVHLGPSTISIDTIYHSKGKLPVVFLRGCGVPVRMIGFLHRMTKKPNKSSSCFISYSSKDTDFANKVYKDLQRRGVRAWFAPEDLKIGDPFPTKIHDAIRMYDKLMLVLSKNSINSPWVRREVRIALAKEKREKRTVLFPIRLDDAFLRTTENWANKIQQNRQVGDFKKWKEHDSYRVAFRPALAGSDDK